MRIIKLVEEVAGAACYRAAPVLRRRRSPDHGPDHGVEHNHLTVGGGL